MTFNALSRKRGKNSQLKYANRQNSRSKCVRKPET